MILPGQKKHTRGRSAALGRPGGSEPAPARLMRTGSAAMNTLRTPLCVLEPQVVAHAEEMFVVLCDPAIYQFEGVPPPSVERLAAGYRRRESRISPDGQEQWLNWVVRRLPGGEATGYVQATVLAGGVSYVGYEFASRFWRQGAWAVRRCAP